MTVSFAFLLTMLIVLKPAMLFPQNVTTIQTEHLRLMSDAFTINDDVSEAVWPGMQEVPFVILLVTEDFEYLIHHPNPTDEFKSLGVDSMLNTEIFYRKRQFGVNLLATFPAVNGVSCVVVGSPSNTNSTPFAWINTLLHEHFHQFQFTQPNWFQDLEQLNISGDDQTGMWMLNYKFPYDDVEVNKHYHKYVNTLHNAIHTSKKVNINKLRKKRQRFRNSISTNDYKYFSMQIWVEGVARYSEYHFLQNFINQNTAIHSPLNSASLEMMTSYNSDMYQSEMEKLISQKLAVNERLCFYAVGFAEAMLLDKIKPQWRSDYLSNTFQLEKILFSN